MEGFPEGHPFWVTGFNYTDYAFIDLNNSYVYVAGQIKP